MSHANLPAPPPLAEGALRIFALGGLGEIGRNMTVFEFDGRLLIVDCGVLFPEESQPGVDLILPDFGPIIDRLDDVEAVVLTHGHEDHIGALPYLLRQRKDSPIVPQRVIREAVVNALMHRSCQPTGKMLGDDDSLSSNPEGLSSNPLSLSSLDCA